MEKKKRWASRILVAVVFLVLGVFTVGGLISSREEMFPDKSERTSATGSSDKLAPVIRSSLMYPLIRSKETSGAIKNYSSSGTKDSPLSPRPTRCILSAAGSIEIKSGRTYFFDEFFCLDGGYRFGLDENGRLAFFLNSGSIWEHENSQAGWQWQYQSDGNLILRDEYDSIIWRSGTSKNFPSKLIMSTENLRIETSTGAILWESSPITRSSQVVALASSSSSSTPKRQSLKRKNPSLRALEPRCIQSSAVLIELRSDKYHGIEEFFCIDGGYMFGLNGNGFLGFFQNSKVIWLNDEVRAGSKWRFQGDGNLVIRDSDEVFVWHSRTYRNAQSILKVTSKGVQIISNSGVILWRTPFIPETPPGNPSTTTLPNTPGTTTSSAVPLPSVPRCIQSSSSTIDIVADPFYGIEEYFCLDGGYRFGLNGNGILGFFQNSEVLWLNSAAGRGSRWRFQGDGNLVVQTSSGGFVWHSRTYGNAGSKMTMSPDGIWIETRSGAVLFRAPSTAGPAPSTPKVPAPSPPTPITPGNPDSNGFLQYFAYYYPWYYRNDWSRHGYQDEPFLGKYGTNEVGVAEQHIEWAVQAGISTWVVSWWGASSLSMRHFKGKSLFCLYKRRGVKIKRRAPSALHF